MESNFGLTVAGMANDVKNQETKIAEAKLALQTATGQLRDYEKGMTARERWAGSALFLVGGNPDKVTRHRELQKVEREKKKTVQDIEEQLETMLAKNASYIEAYLIEHDPQYAKLEETVSKTSAILNAARNVIRELDNAGSKTEQSMWGCW